MFQPSEPLNIVRPSEQTNKEKKPYKPKKREIFNMKPTTKK